MKSQDQRALVTGSSGLIGSEVCVHFCRLGWEVHGVDNNQRAVFFGPQGDTRWNQHRLQRRPARAFRHHELDIRDRGACSTLLVESSGPTLIVHTAAQPCHDRAAAVPFDDFDTNAVGHPEPARGGPPGLPRKPPFVHMSTNKVYGDAPNAIPLRSNSTTRWDYADPAYADGIAETFRIDQSKHSLFGASKVAADVMVQEYGRYFGMPTCCLRGGCLTGPNHSRRRAARLPELPRQVQPRGPRLQDLRLQGQAGARQHPLPRRRPLRRGFIEAPRVAEVYNLGGGRANCVLDPRGLRPDRDSSPAGRWTYEYVDENRMGDHICYISDLSKMRAHYPGWDITKSLDDIFEEIHAAAKAR